MKPRTTENDAKPPSRPKLLLLSAARGFFEGIDSPKAMEEQHSKAELKRRDQLDENGEAETGPLDENTRFRRLLSENPAIVYSRQPYGDFRATFMAPSVNVHLGYDAAEFISDPAFWMDNIHPEDLHGVIHGLSCLFRDGHLVHEYRFRHEDGGYRWMRDESRLLRDGEGNPFEIVGCWIDITDRKLAEQDARQSRERLDMALEAADLGMWECDLTTGVMTFDERWARILGYSLDEVEPHMSAWARFLHPDDVVRVVETFFRHAEGHTSRYEVEYRVRTKDSGIRWVFSRGQIVRGSTTGRPLKIVGTLLDISRRKELEEALHQARHLEAFGKLAAALAHEIRNPLAIASSAGQFLMDDQVPENLRKEFAKKITTAITRSSIVIENLLAFAQRQVMPDKISVDLISLIDDAAKSVAEEARNQGIKMVFEYSHDRVFVMADPRILRLAFVNLFVNSVRAMQRQGGVLTVRVDKDDSEVITTVADTGPGVAEELIERILDPFYSGWSHGETVGLGLSVASSAIKRHSGALEISSTPGKGCVFAVRLPFIP